MTELARIPGIGERVWWWHTANHPLFGTVVEIDGLPGIKPDDDPDILYLDDEQLHRGPLPDGIYPHLAYRSEPGRLSPSAAKKLLQPGGPARFADERRNPKKQEPKFDMGKLAHLFVLGEGDKVAPIYAPDYRTKAAQEQRDKAYENGMIPALASQLDIARAMADEVHADPDAGPLLAQGQPEMWWYATDPETEQPLRLRPDWTTRVDGRLWIVDYKTSGESVDRKTFSRKAYDLGYHLQFAFSIVAARALGMDEQPAMVFVCQETASPYLVAVHELDADAFRVGREDMLLAEAIFREGNATGNWPGHAPGIQSVSLPPYAFRTDWTEPVNID